MGREVGRLMRVARSFVFLVCAAALILGEPGYAAEVTKLKEKGISAAALIERVRTDSGEKLWASELVADEKLTVLLDTKDASKAREALDLLPGYQWVTGVQPDGTRFHVLGPDFGERELWAKRAEAADEENDRLVSKFARRRLQQYIDALRLSDSQLDRLIELDPNLVYELRDPKRRPIIEYLAGLPRSAADQIITENGLGIQTGALPSQVRESVVAALTEDRNASGQSPLASEEAGPVLPEAGVLKLDGYGPDDGLVLSLSLPDPSGSPREVNVAYGMMRPPGYFAEGIRKKLRLAQGMSDAQAEEAAKRDEAAHGARYDRAEKSALEDRLKNHPPRFGSRNAPDVKLERAVQGGSGYELLQELSEVGGMTLVCHYFERSDTNHETVELDTGSLLGSGLDRAVDKLDWRFSSVWAYEDKCILATHAKFVDKLETEIPAHIVAKWRDRAASQGGVLTLDDLAEMATELTDKQMDIWAMPRDLARTGASGLRYEPTHMRLYALLSAEQRAQAWSSGVPYSRMNRMQRRLFEKVAAVHAEEIAADAAIPDTFRLEIEAEKPPRPPGAPKTVIATYSFKGLPPAQGCISVKAIDKSEVKQVAVKSSGVAAPPPIPSEPKALAVAAALAKWSYVAFRPESGTSEMRAVVETKARGEIRRRLLSVGKALEGTETMEIKPECLTFRFGGATIRLPASRAVSLRPYDTEAVSYGDGWVDYLGRLMDY